jgi:hypothetical protein
MLELTFSKELLEKLRTAKCNGLHLKSVMLAFISVLSSN